MYTDNVIRAYRKCARVAENPEDLYQEGFEFAHAALDQRPDCDATRFSLCQLHVALGERLFFAEAYDEARAHFDQVLALCGSIDVNTPRQVEWLRAQALATNRRGTILLRSGQGEVGIAELMTSLRLRERIAAEQPADTESRHDLMMAYSYAARALSDADRVEEAERLFGNAIELGELLRQLDPTVAEWGIELYAAYDAWIQLCLGLDRLETAQTLSARAAPLTEALASLGPEGQRMLGFARILQGRLLLRTGDPDGAYEALQAAVSIRESLLEGHPDHLGYQDDLAVSHAWLARTSRKRGRLDEAERHYQYTYELRQKLRDAQPHIVKRSLDLIKAQINFSVTHIDHREPEHDTAALRLLNDAEQSLLELREAGVLFGFDRPCEIYLTAIKKNQGIVRKRIHRPDTAGNAE